jgi:predicted patatin/cPLA2 family phospholipase
MTYLVTIAHQIFNTEIFYNEQHLTEFEFDNQKDAQQKAKELLATAQKDDTRNKYAEYVSIDKTEPYLDQIFYKEFDLV